MSTNRKICALLRIRIRYNNRVEVCREKSNTADSETVLFLFGIVIIEAQANTTSYRIIHTIQCIVHIRCSHSLMLSLSL